MENTSGQKQINIAVKRSVEIDVLENNMIVVGGTFCVSAEQFHSAMRAALQHPFAESPKRYKRKNRLESGA